MAPASTSLLVPRETVLKVRQAYVEGVPPKQICREYEITRHILYVWLDGGPACLADRLPAIPRRRDLLQRMPRRMRGERNTIVGRLWRSAERHVREIENRLACAGKPEERERDARMMAAMVKTVAELTALEAGGAATVAGKRRAGGAKIAEQYDQSGNASAASGAEPMELAEFRRSLASRLATLVGATDAAARDGDDGAGA
jgi:hypothetical protein